MVALFGPRHGWWRLFVTRRPAIQLTRSVLLLTSTLLFFTAIGRVPLADATAVSFTSPLLVAALAGPILAERLDLGRRRRDHRQRPLHRVARGHAAVARLRPGHS